MSGVDGVSQLDIGITEPNVLSQSTSVVVFRIMLRTNNDKSTQ